MSTPTKPPVIDRIVDLLIDRNHPFWKDERQTAMYNEAAAAALALQGILIVLIGGIGLIVVGTKALGLITAMVLTVVGAQGLVLAMLKRRHIDFDFPGWKQSSTASKRISVSLSIFYLACFFWAKFFEETTSKFDQSTAAGMVVGALSAIGLFAVLATVLVRKLKHGQSMDDRK